MTSAPPAGSIVTGDVPAASPAPATPKEQNLFEKYARLLADHLETDVSSAKQVLLNAPEQLDQLVYKLKAEIAVVKTAIVSGATGLVAGAQDVQSAASAVGAVVDVLDPAAAPEVASAEAAVSAGATVIETVAKDAETAAKAPGNASAASEGANPSVSSTAAGGASPPAAK